VDKKILTWTVLCDMAKHIAKTRPIDYQNLVTVGSDRFIHGHYAQVLNDRVFRIYRTASGSGPMMVDIHGVLSDVGYFTRIRHYLTPSAYRKRFWDRYMPISFPNGLPLRGSRAACTIHSSSGATQAGEIRFSSYRNEAARFSVSCEALGYMLFNDTTGKMVYIGERSNGPPPPQGDAIEVYQYDPADRDTWRNFPWYRQATVSDTLRGVADGAVESRDTWLRSIWTACEAGLMDKYKCLPLAARMWNAAYRFCQNNKDRRARMIAYPIEELAHDRRPRHGSGAVLAWTGSDAVVVNGEQEGIPNALLLVSRYRVPQLEVHWEGDNDLSVCTRSNPAVVSATRMDPRFVCMVLPPHGNPLLYDKPHYASPFSRTQSARNRMNGEYAYDTLDGNPALVSNSDALTVQFLERAYHGLLALDPSKLGSVTSVHTRNRMYNQNVSWESADKGEGGNPFAKWRDYEGCVLVRSNFDEAPSNGKDGPWTEFTAGHCGMPATPESAMSMVEEASLIDSLPLS
jgi:hypothetical protein